MHNDGVTQLYNSIYNKLLQVKWSFAAEKTRTDVKLYLEGASFQAGLQGLLKNSDYSCRTVLELCRSLMEELAQDNIPLNWLEYVYQYVLGKSFPQAVEYKLFKGLEDSCDLYLTVLKAVSEYQKKDNDGTWQSRYPMLPLTPEEEAGLENPNEYKRFLKAFEDEFVYEMMKLNQEVLGFNTLDHICGVHYLAIYIGRELKRAGLPIDLGRVSGSAAGHDIGKYGCKTSELKRVPYLHYYYTDLWFKNHEITYIGHIATNHSTWDLELENLPLESLILIYSDFRVKQKATEKGLEMHIYSLQESFRVILNKLDNVDAAKEKKYRRVYSKLQDFEAYMTNLGIEVDISRIPDGSPKEYKLRNYHFSLVSGNDIIKNIKYLAINHNINLMYRLRDEASLNLILESARSESNWKRLREYIRIFEEYSTYLTQKQKLITIRFLYDQLIHPEDDIRRQCAELMGILIASFDEDYRKEVPEDAILDTPFMTSCELLDRYMQLLIDPDHKMVPLHRSYLGYSISIVVASLFSHCGKSHEEAFRKIISRYYGSGYGKSNDIKLYLLKTVKSVPLHDNQETTAQILDYICGILKEKSITHRVSAFDVAYSILLSYRNRPDASQRVDALEDFRLKIKSLVESSIKKPGAPSLNFIKYRLSVLLDMSPAILDTLSCYCEKDVEKLSEISLSNLKTATEWVIKRVQVDLLLEYSMKDPRANGFYSAMHFCNLLKVSASENVRNRAGEALVQVVPHLSIEQRNDVVVEMLRALEIDGYQFAEYIPKYLGKLILSLAPIELEEVLDDFRDKIKGSTSHLDSLMLKTISIAVANYPSYAEGSKEDREVLQNRLTKMLGVIMNGLAHYDGNVKQAAFSVLGKEIFGAATLTLDEKRSIFTRIAKKLLTMLEDDMQEGLLFLTNSAGLNNIYRFISDYAFFYEDIILAVPEKVAFFPGAFDPFSLGHKEIARAIRDMGFEVYLSVDEFSWSKKTLPNLVRKNIINMSIADEFNIYIYPEDYPTNIANPMDLKVLKDNFPLSEVYIVAGSDVVINASAYKKEKTKNSVQTFSHIIFDRKTSNSQYENDDDPLEDTVGKIGGKVIRLSLPPQYEDISSTQIRNNVDENRDISMLVDTLAQRFIYENGFYQSEPQYKSMIQTKSTEIAVYEDITRELLKELSASLNIPYEALVVRLSGFLKKTSCRLLVVRDAEQDNHILGFSAFHRVNFSLLYQEFRNSSITEYIRSNSTGKIINIDGIFIANHGAVPGLEQTLLTETLAYCLSRDYDYAIYYNTLNDHVSYQVLEVLKLMGFRDIPRSGYSNKVLAVNISTPCTLNLDIETTIKEPFRSNASFMEVVARTRKRLQNTLAEVYSGNLILPFDRAIMDNTLIKKICEVNDVPNKPTTPRRLGPAMCVPYGSMLSRSIIPNTVTKALHTEKLYSPDMKSYEIGNFPYYLDLDIQIKMLHSFEKPIILVDDTLHHGFRIKVLDPLLKKENLKVRKIIVGILSGRGKELMEIQGRDIDCAYFIPRLREWYNENNFYPFIGGDALWRGVYPKRNLLPSINLILPYTSPSFLEETSKKSIFKLSQVAMENAVDLLSVLEDEFQYAYERSLTLYSMGQVFITPRCPDHGKNMDYDLSLSPSHYLKNDLELLNRLEYTICWGE
ncbi:MAG TPA: cytidyltransferase [Clostridia bacterium]|nr:cytidyltransferase [Clostridia bacterium]